MAIREACSCHMLETAELRARGDASSFIMLVVPEDVLRGIERRLRRAVRRSLRAVASITPAPIIHAKQGDGLPQVKARSPNRTTCAFLREVNGPVRTVVKAAENERPAVTIAIKPLALKRCQWSSGRAE